MNSTKRALLALLAVSAIAGLGLVACGDDDDGAEEGLTITDVKARFPGNDVGAVYLTIDNHGEDDAPA